VTNSTGVLDLFQKNKPPPGWLGGSVLEAVPHREGHCCPPRATQELHLQDEASVLLNLSFGGARICVLPEWATPGSFRCELPPGRYDGQLNGLSVVGLPGGARITVTGPITTPGCRSASLIFTLLGQSVELEWLNALEAWLPRHTGCLDSGSGLNDDGILHDHDQCNVGSSFPECTGTSEKWAEDLMLEDGVATVVRPDVRITRVVSANAASLVMADGTRDGQEKVVMCKVSQEDNASLDVTGSFFCKGARTHQLRLPWWSWLMLFWDERLRAWHAVVTGGSSGAVPEPVGQWNPAVEHRIQDEADWGESSSACAQNHIRGLGCHESDKAVSVALSAVLRPSLGAQCVVPSSAEQIWVDASDESFRDSTSECILPDGSADGETKTITATALASNAAVSFAGAVAHVESRQPVMLRQTGDSITLRYNASLHRWFVISTTPRDCDGRNVTHSEEHCRQRDREDPASSVVCPVGSNSNEASRLPVLPADPCFTKRYQFASGDTCGKCLDTSARSSRISTGPCFSGTAICILPDGETDGQRHFVLAVDLAGETKVKVCGQFRERQTNQDHFILQSTGDGAMLEWVDSWGSWCVMTGSPRW